MLDRPEDRFLDLIGDPDWPQDKIAARLRKIRDERGRIARQLDDMDAPRLDAAGEAMLFLLDLLADTKELYRLAGQRGRRALNPALSSKVYCNTDETGPYVASDELSDLVLPLSTKPVTKAAPPWWAVPLRVQVRTLLVEVTRAYLNLADQVTELRTVLAKLARPDAPADEPDLGGM